MKISESLDDKIDFTSQKRRIFSHTSTSGPHLYFGLPGIIVEFMSVWEMRVLGLFLLIGTVTFGLGLYHAKNVLTIVLGGFMALLGA